MVAIAKDQELKVKTKLTYEEFLEICPRDGKYELIDGELVAVANTRQHENIVAFIYKKFDLEIDRLNLDFVVRQNVTIKTNKINGFPQGRVPDISVIDRDTWYSNSSDYSSLIEPIQLAIEVTSTNWTDDYIEKFDEYQRLNIPEYWIVDYKAIASREFLGNSKIPSIFVNLLDANGKYQTFKFTGEAIVKSKTFPELGLTAAQILNI
jgi:Uma2 family endonuclease